MINYIAFLNIYKSFNYFHTQEGSNEYYLS